MSSDSVLHKRAVKHIADIILDSSDLPLLKNAISTLNWNERKYLDTKTSLINNWAAFHGRCGQLPKATVLSTR